jgi:hypothetical protein
MGLGQHQSCSQYKPKFHFTYSIYSTLVRIISYTFLRLLTSHYLIFFSNHVSPYLPFLVGPTYGQGEGRTVLPRGGKGEGGLLLTDYSLCFEHEDVSGQPKIICLLYFDEAANCSHPGKFVKCAKYFHHRALNSSGSTPSVAWV